LDPGQVSNELTNRTGQTQATSPESVLKVAFGNSNQTNVPYIKQQTTNGGIAKDIFIETYVPNRTAQISLANHTTIKAVIPGDPGITAGRTINFDLLTLKPGTNKDLDKFYSGKYLVSAVRHIISSSGYYQTVLELSRDSSKTEYPSIDSNSSVWKKAISS
jgi:ribosomal protein L2